MKRKIYALAVALLMFSCGNSDVDTDQQYLDSWQGVPSGTFVGQNGRLVLGDSSLYVYRSENQEFKNFELYGDFKLSSSAKASLSILTDTLGTGGHTILLSGQEVQGEPTTATIVGKRNIYKNIIDTDSWHSLMIKVIDGSISISIDDNLISSYHQPQQKDSSFSSGTISLQGLSDNSEFRSLRLIKLSADTTISHPKPTDVLVSKLQEQGFALIDFTTIYKQSSVDDLLKESMSSGIMYSLALEPAILREQNDTNIPNYKDSISHKPMLMGLVTSGRDWQKSLSPQTLTKLDYVVADALSFKDHRGRQSSLRADSTVFVDIPLSMYMDIVLDRTIKIINTEQFDILQDVTLLPPSLMSKHSRLWTRQRTDKLIAAIKARGVAVEIDGELKLPTKEFIKRAKAAGVKFVIGKSKSSLYALEVIEDIGLTTDHMWYPQR